MARIDDYRAALQLGKEALADKNPKRIADRSGAIFKQDSEGIATLTLDFLNRKVIITWPNFDISFAESGDEVPIQQQVLLLHYLIGAKNRPLVDSGLHTRRFLTGSSIWMPF